MTSIRLAQIGAGCPEQYDAATADGRIVGWAGLRRGWFTVMAGDTEVYGKDIAGTDGVFDVDERQHYLDIAVTKIAEHLDGPAMPDAARAEQAAQAIAVALEEAAIAAWDRDDGDGKVIEIYVSQIAPIVARMLCGQS